MKKSVVAIVKGSKNPTEKEIDASVRKAIGLIGGLTDIISRGDTVIIKPNLVIPQSPQTGTTTDPRVCKSIANMVKEIGAKPIIAEASAVGIDTEEAFKAAGYAQLREEGYQVIDLKKEATVKVPVPKGKSLKEVSLPKLVLEAKVISVPAMKTHDQTTVTLSLKNMKGLLPDTYKRKFHTTFGLYQGVADLCTVMRPALAVVDGIVAQEGLGPMFGLPVGMGLIIAGKDPVAVDAVTSVVMGFGPRESGCIDAAHKMKVGTADLTKIEVVGEPIVNVQRRFKRAEEGVFDLITTLPEGFDLVLDEKACTGCRNCVLSSLVDLKEQGKLERAAGLTIVAGKIDRLPDVNQEHLILVGNCTARFKNYGRYVQGCTPNNRDVVAGVLGEESKVLYTARGGLVAQKE